MYSLWLLQVASTKFQYIFFLFGSLLLNSHCEWYKWSCHCHCPLELVDCEKTDRAQTRRDTQSLPGTDVFQRRRSTDSSGERSWNKYVQLVSVRLPFCLCVCLSICLSVCLN